VFCDQTEEKVKALAPARPMPKKWRRLSIGSPKNSLKRYALREHCSERRPLTMLAAGICSDEATKNSESGLP
jgi:hypothetical protein